MRACGVWVAAAAVLMACGCGGGSGPKGVPVNGTVSLNGKPLPEGEVLFEPADGKGAPDQALVKEGKFSGSVTPGAKKVRITSWREGKRPADAAMGGGAMLEQYLPKKYNTETTLTATVEAGGGQLPAFDLKER
ncbi:MAG: hypothetical protein ACOVT5_03990 [Armatimonadaceae bacterium]